MASEKWGKFFDFSTLDSKRMKGCCKLCEKDYTDYRGIYSNFIKHLRRKHRSHYDMVTSTNDENENETGNVVTDDKTANVPSNNKNKENQFAMSVTQNLIIKCGLPFCLVEKPAFRAFLKDLNVKVNPLSAKKIKRVTIPSCKNSVLQKICTALKQTNDITLTIDGWSDRRCRSYLGITCHFLDDKMIPQSCLINFLRMKSPHTAFNIHQLTEDALEKFDVKEKIFKIVTDNASNMINAYKFGLFGEENVEVNDHEMSIPSDGTLNQFDYDGEFYSIDCNIPDEKNLLKK